MNGVLCNAKGLNPLNFMLIKILQKQQLSYEQTSKCLRLWAFTGALLHSYGAFHYGKSLYLEIVSLMEANPISGYRSNLRKQPVLGETLVNYYPRVMVLDYDVGGHCRTLTWCYAMRKAYIEEEYF